MLLSEKEIESELSYAYLHAVASRAGFACEYAGRHSDRAGNRCAHSCQGEDGSRLNLHGLHGRGSTESNMPAANYVKRTLFLLVITGSLRQTPKRGHGECSPLGCTFSSGGPGPLARSFRGRSGLKALRLLGVPERRRCVRQQERADRVSSQVPTFFPMMGCVN